MADLLRRTFAAIMAPCSVKTIGSFRRPPWVEPVPNCDRFRLALEVANCDFKFAASCSVRTNNFLLPHARIPWLFRSFTSIPFYFSRRPPPRRAGLPPRHIYREILRQVFFSGTGFKIAHFVPQSKTF